MGMQKRLAVLLLPPLLPPLLLLSAPLGLEGLEGLLMGPLEPEPLVALLVALPLPLLPAL